MRKIISIILLAAAGIAAMVLPFAGLEQAGSGPASINAAVFFPARYPQGQWKPLGLNYRDVYFQSSDHTPLHGWFCPVAGSRHTILIAHGNAGNIATRVEMLRRLQNSTRATVFIFDYRGYGRSSGKPDIDGAIRDAQAARQQLRQLASVTDAEMILWGESIGGAIAVQLAADSPPRALILQSTFSSLKDMAMVHYPQYAAAVPAGVLDSTGKIKNYRGKLFQSHGGRDQIVPLRLAQKVFDAANCKKEFVVVPGKGHNNWRTPEYDQRLNKFIGSTTARE